MSDRSDDFFDTTGSWYRYEALRWQRYAREPPLVSGTVLLIAVSTLVLAGFVTADAYALTTTPVKVTVTQVNWFVGNFSVGNQSGFQVAGGHDFALGLICEIFCPTFTGVTVAAPFSLVNDTIAYPWFEYVNLTVRAPGSAFDGPLTITLQV